MPKLSPSNTCTFSLRHIIFTYQHQTTLQLYTPGPFWTVKSPIKSTGMWKMWHYKDHQKDICLHWELKQEGRVSPCFTLSWEGAHWATQISPHCACPRMMVKALQVVIWGYKQIQGRKWIHIYWYLWKMRADSSSSSNDSAHHNFKY